MVESAAEKEQTLNSERLVVAQFRKHTQTFVFVLTNFISVILTTSPIFFSATTLRAVPGYTMHVDKKWTDKTLRIPFEKREKTLRFTIQQTRERSAFPTTEAAMEDLFEQFSINAISVTDVDVSLRNFQWCTQETTKAQTSRAAYAAHLDNIDKNLSFLKHRFFFSIKSLMLSGITLSSNVNKMLTKNLQTPGRYTRLSLSIDAVESFNKLRFSGSLRSLTLDCKKFTQAIPKVDIQQMLSGLEQLEQLSASTNILPALIELLPSRENLVSVSVTNFDNTNNYQELEQQLLRCPNLRELTLNISTCGYITSRECFTRLEGLPLDAWLHRILHERPKPVQYPDLNDGSSDDAADQAIKQACATVRALKLASANPEDITLCLAQLRLCWPEDAFVNGTQKKRRQYIQTVMGKLEEITTWCDLAPQHNEFIEAILQPFIGYIKDNTDDQFDRYLELCRLLRNRPALLTTQSICTVVGTLLSHIITVGARRTTPANRYLEGKLLISSIAGAEPIIENTDLPYRGWIESCIETSFITNDYHGHEIYELCQKLFKTSLAPYIVAMYLRKIALIKQGTHSLSQDVVQNAFAIFAHNTRWNNDAAQFTRSIETFFAATQSYAPDGEGLESILNETVYPDKNSIESILLKNLAAAPTAQLAANLDLIVALKQQFPKNSASLWGTIKHKITEHYLAAFAGKLDDDTAWHWRNAAEKKLPYVLADMPDNQHAQSLRYLLYDNTNDDYSDDSDFSDDDDDDEIGIADLDLAMASMSLQPSQRSPRSRNSQMTTLCEQLQSKGKECFLEFIKEATIKLLRNKMNQPLSPQDSFKHCEHVAIIITAQQFLHDETIVNAATEYISWLITIGGKEQPLVGLKCLTMNEGDDALAKFITALLAVEHQTFQLAAALRILYTLVIADQRQEQPRKYCHFDEEHGLFFPLLIDALGAADASDDPTVIVVRDVLKEKNLACYSWLLNEEGLL